MQLQQIDADLKEALLSADRLRVELLRGLKAAIVNEAIASKCNAQQVNLTKVVQKEIKKREQAIELYQAAGRTELADKESKERDILRAYLPTELSQEEVIPYVKRAIEATSAQGLADMGKVMKHLQQQAELNGVEGAMLAKLTKEQLA